MFDINWLQEVKMLVKITTCWNIWLFLSNIQGEIVFQKLQNLWVAKVLMSSYILCKILSFQARVAQEVFNTSGSYSLAELIILWTFNIQNWFICSSIRNWIAYANEANIVNKDSPIPKRDLDTKKTTPDIEVWPKSLGTKLEYGYIERGSNTICGHAAPKW